MSLRLERHHSLVALADTLEDPHGSGVDHGVHWDSGSVVLHGHEGTRDLTRPRSPTRIEDGRAGVPGKGAEYSPGDPNALVVSTEETGDGCGHPGTP